MKDALRGTVGFEVIGAWRAGYGWRSADASLRFTSLLASAERGGKGGQRVKAGKGSVTVNRNRIWLLLGGLGVILVCSCLVAIGGGG